MGIDAKAILPSRPGPQEVAAALHAAFGCEATVHESGVRDSSFFYVHFEDPEVHGKPRRLAVFLDSGDDREVHEGPNTQCSLSASGGSGRIVDALADAFGGFVCYNDANGGWSFRERLAAGSGTDCLSARARLKVEIERVLGPGDAVALARLADDQEALDAVMEAYGRYRASAEPGQAPRP